MDSCISVVVLLRLLWFWLSGYAFPDLVAGMGWLFFGDSSCVVVVSNNDYVVSTL